MTFVSMRSIIKRRQTSCCCSTLTHTIKLHYEKIKYKIQIVVAITLSLVMQSCLFEDDELFEQSSSERIGELIESTRTILESNQRGWVMEFFPSLSYGGYNFVMVFADGKATISCETAEPDYTEECLYDVIKEDGAILTFNTYSNILQK